MQHAGRQPGAARTDPNSRTETGMVHDPNARGNLPPRTRGEDVAAILSEASGRPPAHVRHLLDAFRAVLPPNATRLDTVVPEPEASELLAKLRTELPGIRAWLVRGAMEACR